MGRADHRAAQLFSGVQVNNREHDLNAAVAAYRSGDYKQVEQLSQAILRTAPEHIDALLMLVLALEAQGMPEQALPHYRRLVELQPREAAHWANLAQALAAADQGAEAETAFRNALELAPGDASLLTRLGLFRWHKGDNPGARECLMRAAQADPGVPEARIYGALACYECADLQGAEMLLADRARWQYLGPQLESELASVLTNLGHSEEAERRLRQLLGNPEAAQQAQLRLVGLLERVNRVAEAQRMLDEIETPTGVVSEAREHALLQATLAARTKQYELSIGHYRQALSAHDAQPRDAVHWFAWARTLAESGAVEDAMHVAEHAHELQLRGLAVAAPHLLDPARPLLDIVDCPVLPEHRANARDCAQEPGVQQSPLFVVGFPRSGTTLVETMLDAHPGVHGMDERAFIQRAIDGMQQNGKSYPEDLWRLDAPLVEQLREGYWERCHGVVALARNDRLVDKNPLNMLRLGMINRLFPNARILLLLRHPCDVLISNYFQSYRLPEFQAMCSVLPRLARTYVRAMTFALDQSEVLGASTLQVRYEDLVADFEHQARRIVEHFELHDEQALARFQQQALARGYIATPSYAQVTEPLNARAVGRWRTYRRWLEPVLPQLSPLCQRFGYSLD